MSGSFISHYTPSMMSAETLEAIFVLRQPLAERLVDKVVESSTKGAKHHVLLIGPRGIGKTHLISLLYHRIKERSELAGGLAIAWLREEEYRVSSYLDLLVAVVEGVWQEEGAEPPPEYEALYELPEEHREEAAEQLLLNAIGERTLLLLAENFSDIFAGLGKGGQHKFRALIQNQPVFTILATSQSLFHAVSLRTNPFFGFFEITHLEGFGVDDAVKMLTRIADRDGDGALVKLLAEPKGRASVRALNHLAGGNPRIFVIFSQFLGADSLDSLVEPVMKTIDDLTPYYQSRLKELSPQQRKIVEYLCRRQGAASVAEIAKRNFMSSQTASSQLKKLADLGYVRSETVGRESFYEPREALMRIALDVKRHRGKPVQILVDFLRIWFRSSELRERLEGLSRDGQQADQVYLREALKISAAEHEDPVVRSAESDYQAYLSKGEIDQALRVADELVEVSGAKGWLKKGAAYWQSDRYEEALDAYDHALKINPEDALAWRNRGGTLHDLGRYEEALESYDRTLRIKPKDIIALNNRGRALSHLGRREEALAAYDHTLKIKPEDALAWRNRASTLNGLGRHEEALEAYDHTLKIKPEDALAWRNRASTLDDLGRYEEALEAYDRALTIKPEDAIALNNRGAALDRLGRHEEALEAYDHTLKIKPEDALAWRNRASTLDDLGRYEGALEAYDRALKIKPEDDIALNNRGTALSHLGRHEEALEAYDHTLKIKPEYALAWRNRASTLAALGRHEEALEAYDHTLKIKPEDALAWRNRASTLDDLGRYEGALEAYDRALKIKPEDDIALNNRGTALSHLGRHEEALEAYDHTLKIKPEYALAWRNRASTLAALGRYEEALEAYDHTLKIKPEDALAWRNRASTLADLGRYEEALEAFDRALTIKPEDALACTNRGAALRMLGRYQEELEADDHARRIDPDCATAWYGRGVALGEFGRYEEALESVRKATSLEPSPLFTLGGGQLEYVLGHRPSQLIDVSEGDDSDDFSSIAIDARFLKATIAMELAEPEPASRLAAEVAEAAVDHEARPTLWPLLARFALHGGLGLLRSLIEGWVAAYRQHNSLEHLAGSVTESIRWVHEPALRQAGATWVETWREVAGDESAMEPALRMLDVAVRYLESDDRRTLLELPQEERSIVEPLLGLTKADRNLSGRAV